MCDLAAVMYYAARPGNDLSDPANHAARARNDLRGPAYYTARCLNHLAEFRGTSTVTVALEELPELSTAVIVIV